MRALILLLILLCPAWAMATPRSIHVEWGYTPPSEPAVTGFRLYQEGAAVHDLAQYVPASHADSRKHNGTYSG